MNVKDALKAREEREKKETTIANLKAKSDKVSSALDAYKSRKKSSSESAVSDLAKRINSEIEAIKKVSDPSWGEGSLKNTLDSTRESRVRVSELTQEVESYKNYLDDETYNSLISSLKQLTEGYDSHLKVSEVRSEYKSEDEYNDYVKQAEEQQKRYNEFVKINNMSSDELKGKLISREDYDIIWELSHVNVAYDRDTALANGTEEATYNDIEAKRKYISDKYGVDLYYDIYNNVNIFNDLMSRYNNGGGIAYTTEDGQNVTWQSLYESKKAEEEFNRLYSQYSARPDWSGNTYKVNAAFGTMSDYEILYALNTTTVPYDKDTALANGIDEATYNDIEKKRKYISDKYGVDLYSDIYNNINIINGLMSRLEGDSTEKDTVEYMSYMTYKEQELFNYIYNTQGRSAALKWHNSRKSIYQQRAKQINTEQLKELAMENTFWASVGSVALNLGAGIEYITDLIDYKVTGEDQVNTLAYSANALRSGVSEKTDWMIGNWDAFDFVYNTAMSGIDSATSMLAFGGLGGVSLGLSAAASATEDALSRGLSQGDAFWNGLFAGVFEGLFESVSIGQFKALKESATTGLKSFALNLGKTMLTNASEETLTEIANIAYDRIINGDFSSYETMIRQYMNMGLSESEAKAKASTELARQIVESGASGALMGFGFGVVGSGSSYLNYKSQYNKQATQHGQAILDEGGQTSVDALKELALEVSGVKKDSEGKKLANLAGKVDKKATAKNVGKLSAQLESTITGQNRTDIESALVEKGLSKKDAKRVAEYLGSTSKLTAEQQAEIENNESIKAVVTELLENPKSTISERGRNLLAARLGVDTKNAKINASKSGDISLRNDVDVKDKVSESAKTTIASTGEAITIDKKNPIAKVQYVGDERVVYYNTDRGVVKSTDIEYASEAEGLLYEAFVDMNPAFANAVIRNYDGSVPIQNYIYGMREGMILYGMHNFQAVGKDISKNSFLASLSEADQAFALKLGRAYAKADAKKANADLHRAIKNAAEKAKASEGVSSPESTQNKAKKGKVSFENGAKIETHKQHRKIVSLAKVLARAIGIDIVFYDSRITNDPNGKGSNGYYDADNDTIHLDLQNAADDAKTIAFTLSHELVHFIKKWSPQKYAAFAEFLMDQYASHGVSASNLLQQKMVDLNTTDADMAYEEMICDACETMLLDSNAVVKLMELRKNDLELFEKIKLHVLKILNDIRDMYKKLGYQPTSDEAKALLGMKDVLEKFYTMFEEAAVDATQNYQALGTEGYNELVAKSTKYAKLDTASVSVTEDGTIKLQMKQYQQTGRSTLLNYLTEQYGKDDAYDLISTIDNIYNTMAEIKKDEALSVFSNWQDTEIELDENGHPIFTTSINNGDYDLNQDFSRVCKKRRQLDFVLNMLAEDPAFEASHLTKQDFVKINQAIKNHGFEIACALCFVDSKRFRQAEWADSFANTWNDILNAVVKDSSKLTPFNFATKNPNISDDGIEIDTSKAVTYRKWSEGKEDVKNRRTYESFEQMLSKADDGKWLEGNTNVRTIATLIRDNPNLRHTFRGADIIASQGFDTIQRLAPGIRSILDGWGGSSVPKPSSNDASYDSSIINMSGYNKKTAYAMGGVRMNSFSDFMAHMFFDYCQAFADLSAKELPSQAYTKELIYVRLFGRSGQKINMSGIAAIRDDALPTTAGKGVTKAEAEANEKIEKMVAGLDVTRLLEQLNKDIHQLTEEDVEQFLDMCDYVWADESINMKHATLLQTGILYDKLSESKIEECYELLKAGEIEQALKVAGEENVDTEYAKNCGTIVVGVSDAHIRKLLRDPTVRMVIPYHKSGLNPIIARELKISAYNDYTLTQTTGVKRKGTKTTEKIGSTAIKDAYGLKDFAFYDWFGKTIDGKLYDGKATADKYLEWCEKGYYDENVGDYVYYTTKGDGYILAKDFHKKASIVPKFDAFSGEENYYKVLEDFDCYDTITGEHSAQGAVDFFHNGLPSDYKTVLVDALKEEQKVHDDFRDHLDNKGLKDEVMAIVKPRGYEPSIKKQAKPSKKDPRYLDPRTVTEEDVVELLNNVNKGIYDDGTHIPLRISTPPMLIYWAKKKRGDVIDNNPISMEVEKASQAMAREGWDQEHRPHKLSVDDMVSVIKKMNDPRYIVYQGTNGRYVEVIEYVTEDSRKVFAILEIGDFKDAPYMNGFEGGIYNVFVTVYPPDAGKLSELLNHSKNKVIYDKGKDLSQVTSDSIVSSVLNDKPFYEGIITQENPKVKRQLKKTSSEEIEARRAKAVETFGTTTDYAKAGFILPDGNMLNLGKVSTMGGVQHRAIKSVFEDTSGDVVNQFIQEGNVRIKAESPGIEISADTPVTERQLNTISSFAARSLKEKGYLYLDIVDSNGNWVASVEYKDFHDQYDVKYDIRDYYKRGDIPKPRPYYFQKKMPSNRSLLANALESVAQNDIERNKLKQYKEKIALIESEQAKLAEVKDKANEIRFTKGRTAEETKTMKSLDFEANQIANRINTYDRQLLNLESTAALKGVIQREKEMARRKEAQKGKEALAKYREKVAKTQQELLTRYQESRKKGVERRKMSEVRTKIKNFKQKLESALQHPTDRKYVPVNLVQAMVDVCNLIDTDTPLYKEDGSLNKAQERRNATKEKLQALKDEYENLKTNADPMYKEEFDEVIYKYLTKLRIDFEGKSLSDMTLAELNEMYDILKSIDGTLKEARKLIGWGDASLVYEAGDTIIEEQKAITESRKNGKRSAAQKAKDSVIDISLSPVRNVERMSGYRANSPLLKLFKEFEKGIRKKNMFAMESHKMFEALTTGANAKNYENAIYNEYGSEYTDVNGRKFKVSKMMMMQAAMSYERETANKMHHIEGSGFSFADLDLLRKGKLREAVSEEHSHRMTIGIAMAESFAKALANDKWAQDYMAMARQFFDVKAKDAVNETYITLKHRIIARDKNYIPFEVDKNFVVREISAENDIQQTINSYGMLQETKDGASQPLIITGLNNILERHIDQVGNVYGLAVSVRNFNKVWNVRSVESGFGGDPTVQAAIERNWGVGGKKFITQAVQDIQGPRPNAQSDLYRKVKSNYIGATFLLNLSVVTKQIGSLFASTSMLRFRDPASMMANLVYTMANYKKISAEVDKYTASVWMRRQGLSDAELYTLATAAKEGGLPKLLSKLPTFINPTKWIAGMDSAVALSLWKYAKEDTAKRTGLEGEELLKATAEFFDEVVENTQSMTDVLHRPEVQKRSDVFSEAFGMFKTDLYQMAGQLQVNLGRYQHNKTKENGAALARTAYSIAMSAVWGSLMTTLFALLRYKVNPYRDDEDDELTVESWLKKGLTGLLGDVVGYIFPLAGSEFVGLIENIMYGESDDIVDSLALTAMNDAYSAIIMFANAIKEGEMPSAQEWEKLVVKSLQLFGVPSNNIARMVNAIRLHAKDIANGEFFSFEAGLDKPNKQRLYEAMISGDAKKIEKAKRNYKDQKAIDSALRTALQENDSRIKEAAVARHNGDIAEYMRIAKEIIAEGHFKQDDIVAAINSEISALKKGEGTTTSSSSDKVTSIYKVDDYYAALIGRDQATAYVVKEDLIKTDVANGKDREEAEADFNSKFTSYLREEYEGGNLSDYEAKNMLVNYAGKSEEEADSKVQYWDFKQEYPEYDLSEEAVKKYYDEVEPSGIGIKVYYDYTKQRAKCKGTDSNGDGKTDSGSVKKEVLDVIDSLPITYAQKDALYYLNGWSASTIYEAPWH